MKESIRGCEFICGQRGQGKTQYIKQKILKNENRFLLYDHMAEFINLNDVTVCNDIKEVVNYFKSHKKGIARVVFATTDSTPEEFNLVCKIPFAFDNMVLICDEIDNFATPTSSPKEFKRIIHYGRHAGISFVGASRRPANVSRDFTSQSKRIVCFRITEPKDITFLESVVGKDARKIKHLQPLNYLAFENGKTLTGKLEIPKS